MREVRVPQTISLDRLIDALRMLGIDAKITTEVHIVMRPGPDVHGAGIELTVVQYAVNDRGERYIEPAAVKVATTMMIEE